MDFDLGFVNRRQARKRRDELESVKKRLDEGRNISLSPSSEHETTCEAAVAEKEKDDDDLRFISMTSSIFEEMEGILSELSSSEAEWPDRSDPDLEGVLLDLAGTERIATPFQLADRVKRELVRRAEASGARALEWSLPSFDRVGGSGTLRTMWDRLKGETGERKKERACGRM